MPRTRRPPTAVAVVSACCASTAGGRPLQLFAELAQRIGPGRCQQGRADAHALSPFRSGALSLSLWLLRRLILPGPAPVRKAHAAAPPPADAVCGSIRLLPRDHEVN